MKKTKTLTLAEERAGTPEAILKAKAVMSPAAQGALSIAGAGGEFGDPSTEVLLEDLEKQSSNVAAGDLTKLEKMLAVQTATLDVAFNRFLRVAFRNLDRHAPYTDLFMRLAFKCQAQCRANVEALAEMKNPQTTAFIRQQNIATNQQVNNGRPCPPAEPARAEDQKADRSNKLIGVGNEQRPYLDATAASAASTGDPPMAAVGKVHRANVDAG